MDISKITSTFNLLHPSLTVSPHCSLGVCQSVVDAAVLIALLEARAKLLLQLSGCTESRCTLHLSTQRKSPVQVPPWDGCRRPIYLLLSGSDLCPHPMPCALPGVAGTCSRGFTYATLFKDDVALLLLGDAGLCKISYWEGWLSSKTGITIVMVLHNSYIKKLWDFLSCGLTHALHV